MIYYTRIDDLLIFYILKKRPETLVSDVKTALLQGKKRK